jgi:2-hydroxy-3-keto-5-methylthiopentenyl-1-phosphate phosphatase
MKYCKQKGIPFVPFDNWDSILDAMRDIYERTVKT